MRRGDIVLVADRTGGDNSSKPRPAVVVESDLFAGTQSVVVCPLTSEAKDAALLRIPILPGDRSGLREASWIMVDKLTCIRRDRVGGAIGRLSHTETVALNRSLAVFLGFA